MRSFNNVRNSSKFSKFREDSDAEEYPVASEHSRQELTENRTPVMKESDYRKYNRNSYSRNNHNNQDDSPTNDLYDSEEISPEGKKLIIKQPIRSNIRRNSSSSNQSNINNNMYQSTNTNTTVTSSFIPKDIKNHKMKSTEEEETSTSNRIRITKGYINEDESSPPSYRESEYYNSRKVDNKTKKKPIARQFIQPTHNYKKDDLYEENNTIVKNNVINNMIVNKIDSEDEDYLDKNPSALDDFNDISIERTSRLDISNNNNNNNISQQPSFTVKRAFHTSPNKTNEQHEIKNNNSIPLLSPLKIITQSIDEDDDENSIEYLDEDGNNDNHSIISKGSNYSFDPTVIKDGEFYSDYLEKSKNNLIKANKSGRYDDDNEVNSYKNQSQNEISSKDSILNASINKQLLKSSWISVQLDHTKNDISSKFSFVQVAHERGIKTERIHCTIIRDKKNTIQGKMYPSYAMILEETNKPIIIAQKMNMNRTSNYHLFDMTRAQLSSKLSKKSGNYIGKLRATNANRTEYVLLNQNSEKEEIAGIKFDRLSIINQLKDGNQPRKMKVMVPVLNENRIPIPNRIQDKDGSGSLAEKLIKYETNSYNSEKYSDLYVFESKDPVFENGNYRLNFSGRVNLPSVKNFQMVSKNDINDIICQFGKVDEDIFHLDYKAPINACQAFAFALCQFNL